MLISLNTSSSENAGATAPAPAKAAAPAKATAPAPRDKSNPNAFRPFPRTARTLAAPAKFQWDTNTAEPRKVCALAVQKEPVLIANNTHNLSQQNINLRKSREDKPPLIGPMKEDQLRIYEDLVGKPKEGSVTEVIVKKPACVGCVEVNRQMSQAVPGEICIKNPRPDQFLAVLLAHCKTGELCAQDYKDYKRWGPVVSFSSRGKIGQEYAITKIVPPKDGGDLEMDVYVTLRPPISNGATSCQKRKMEDGKSVKKTDNSFPISDPLTQYVLIFVVVDKNCPLFDQLGMNLPTLKRKHDGDNEYKTLLTYLMKKDPEVARLVKEAKTDNDAPNVPDDLLE